MFDNIRRFDNVHIYDNLSMLSYIYLIACACYSNACCVTDRHKVSSRLVMSSSWDGVSVSPVTEQDTAGVVSLAVAETVEGGRGSLVVSG